MDSAIKEYDFETKTLEEFLDEINRELKEYCSKIETVEQDQSVLNRVNKVKEDFEEQRKRIEQTYKAKLEYIEREKEKKQKEVEDTRVEIEKMEYYLPAVTNTHKYLAETPKIRTEALDILAELKLLQEEKLSLIQQEYDILKQEAEELRKAENRKTEILCNEQIEELYSEDTIFKQKMGEQIKEQMREFLRSERNRVSIEKLGRRAESMFEYSDKEELPEDLYLGKIALNKGAVAKAYQEFIFSEFEIVRKKVEKELFLSYKRREGFALYADIDIKKNMEGIQSLLIRQMCDFPAGRLELVLLDKSNTAVFSVLEIELRKSDHRNIAISRTDAKEIENQIADVRKRLENSIHEYNNQFEEKTEARERRENFRILALAGFPEGLSIEALQDLNMIVKEGKAYGVYTLIIADALAVNRAKVDADKAYMLQQILEQMDYVTEEAGNLFIHKKANESRIKLAYQMDVSISKNRYISILKDITKGIVEYNKKPLTLDNISSPIINQMEWQSFSSKDGIRVPVGRHGYDDIIQIVLGQHGTADRPDTRHHMLIEGATGAGKSSLLHTFITSALLMYDPSELEIFYLDFKVGVEASVYSKYELPAFKVISVGGDHEFGLKTLQQILELMYKREEIIKDAIGCNISSTSLKQYRELSPHNKMSRVLLVIDEVGLFLDGGDVSDEFRSECLKIINILVAAARNVGIHVILAAQSINLSNEILRNMTVRVAYSGSDTLLESDSNTLQSAINAGNHAIFNDMSGVQSANRPFKGVLISQEQQTEFLAQLSSVQVGHNCLGQSDIPVKIFYSKVDSNRKHPFNDVLIQNKLEKKAEEIAIPVFVGEAYDFVKSFDINLLRHENANLLIAGKEIRKTCRLLYHVVLSFIHHNLMVGCVDNQNIHIIDFGLESEVGKNHFALIETLFFQQIARIIVEEDDYEEDAVWKAKEEIDKVYKEFKRREEQCKFSERNEYLIINGAEYLEQILDNQLYNENFDDLFGRQSKANVSVLEQIKVLVKNGAKYGIHCVIQTNECEVLQDYLGNNSENFFNYRIAYDLQQEQMKMLVRELEHKGCSSYSAIFYQTGKRLNRMFRIYDYPKKDWLYEYASKYEEVVE